MKMIINSEVFISNDRKVESTDDYVVDQPEYCYGLSGIVFNHNDLNNKEIPRYIIEGSIQRYYKGSYVVWFYDKKNQKVYISNDLLSKQSVYYYAVDGLILINTSLFDLCSDLRSSGRVPRINLEAVDYFCRENVFQGDMTYEANTFFLTAYSYLVIDCRNKTLEIKRLPIPKLKSSGDITDNEALEVIENLFSEACKLQWYKNEINKKDQIMTISGGMDSRAVLLHLMSMQNFTKKIKVYTYAQTNSEDAMIANKLAEKNGLDSTFIPLDNCEFAFRRDDIIDANEGQMFYLGSTGAIMMAELCCKNLSPFIVHTGLGGGEVLGDMCVANGDDVQDQYSGMTINQERNLNDIRRCLNFQKTTSKYFHAASPFLDEDFFEFVMCLPASMRMHRKLYINWYKKSMNSDFPSTSSHSLVMKAINRIKIKTYKAIGCRNPSDMNPIEYWYEKNMQLRSYIDTTWEHDCMALAEHENLLELLTDYFNRGVIQKFAVLTVTGSVLRILGIDGK